MPAAPTGAGRWSSPEPPQKADGSYDREELRLRAIVAIGIAGSLGALARYGLDGLVSRRFQSPFPWGTFVVNMSGAFVLGFLMTLMTEQLTTAPWLRSALTIGLLGAYTTFSTLSYETYRLLEDGAFGLAAANLLGSAAAGLVAVYLGVVAGRAV
jgi:fluoride exporter